MSPECLHSIDYTKYVYAICRCTVPVNWAIKIKRKPGTTRYHFVCEKCKTEGYIYAAELGTDEIRGGANGEDIFRCCSNNKNNS